MRPDSLYNARLEVGKAFGMTRYPSSWKSHLSVHYATLGGVDCLLLEVKGKVKLPSLLQVVRRLSQDSGLPPLVLSSDFNAYQRERLSEENVSWVASEKNFHVPFLAMSASQRTLPNPTIKKFSPHAQRILLNCVTGAWANMSTTQVSKKLGKSLSSAVTYFKEIAAASPELVKADGRTKYLAALDPEKAWEAVDDMMGFLSSPVKQRVFLQTDIDVDHLLHRGFRYAGFSALSRETGTPYDTLTTLAATQRDFDAQKRALAGSRIVDDPEDANLLVQIWTYSVEDGDGDTVDPLSLWLSLKLPSADGQVGVERSLLNGEAAEAVPETAVSEPEAAAPQPPFAHSPAEPAAPAEAFMPGSVSEEPPVQEGDIAALRSRQRQTVSSPAALSESAPVDGSAPTEASQDSPPPSVSWSERVAAARAAKAAKDAEAKAPMPSWMTEGAAGVPARTYDPDAYRQTSRGASREPAAAQHEYLREEPPMPMDSTSTGLTGRIPPITAHNREPDSEAVRDRQRRPTRRKADRGREGRVLVDNPHPNERLY